METLVDNSNASLSGPNVCCIYGRKYDLSQFKKRILETGYGYPGWNQIERDLFNYIGCIAFTGASALALRIYSIKAVPSTFDEKEFWKLKILPDGTKKYVSPQPDPKKTKLNHFLNSISDEEIFMIGALTAIRSHRRRKNK